MKRIQLFPLLLIVLMFIFQSTFAQRGDGAVGLRATPDGGGFTIKGFMSRYLAFDGMLNIGGVTYRPGASYTAVGLLEAHIPLPDPSWRLIFGAGLHGGVWDNGPWYNYRQDYWEYNRSEPIFGIDGIGGVEYVFKKIPLGLSADIKPAINFSGAGPYLFDHNMFGLSARYYFN